MIAYVNYLKPVTISPVVQRILSSGKITRADERFFMWVMAAGKPLTNEEMKQVSDVVDRFQLGLLKLADTDRPPQHPTSDAPLPTSLL